MGVNLKLRHIDDVLSSVDRPDPAPGQRDPLILQSWQRCVQQHGLDPSVMREAVILPSAQIREHAERLEEFLRVARHGVESLYRSVAGMGYVMLLTDSRGITVDFIGDGALEEQLRKTGLYLGADWSEIHAGTCGVGTCLSSGQPLTVHQTDHFDATHIPLTCSVAPIYDPFGELLAALDISALKSPGPKSSQHLALQLVQIYAHKIENANFLHQFRRQWQIHLSTSCEFVDVDADYLLALDDNGRLLGFNHRARQLLCQELGRALHPAELIGLPFESLFECSVGDLPRLARALPSEQRALRTSHQRQLLFALANPPAPATGNGRRERWHDGDCNRPALHPALATLTGGDPAMDRLLTQAARLANARVSILLSGETGTGKERLARALHDASLRADKPFIAVNCAAIPEALIESELFGYAPGTFTGAQRRGKTGLILAANGGTLLLDEIGDMPLALQSRLLRVLAEQEVLPLGANRPLPVDIRVIAATHYDLLERVRRGDFRDDLFYRLNGASFELPPLRERTDLDYLLQQLLQAETGTGHSPLLSPDAHARLQAHHWPGNIRELRNVIQYACAVCDGQQIAVDDLPDTLTTAARRPPTDQATPPTCPGRQPGPVSPPPAQQLQRCLSQQRWNVSAAARELGICRATVYRRMQRYGIVPPHWR